MQHFGCPKFTLDHISGHFRSIDIFFFYFVQNGCQWPFWMFENHFRSHFWPFQIDTQLYFCFEIFDKMAAVGQFGCPNLTFDRISGHFRSIRNFNLFWNFWQNGCRRPFWMSEIHFGSHFWPFQIDRPFWISEIHFRSQFCPFLIDTNFFGGHFGCLKITLDAAHKETSALLQSTQNIVRRKHHVPVHGVPSTAIIVPNYVRYDAKTSLDY